MEHQKNNVGDELLWQSFCGNEKYFRYDSAAHFHDHHQAFVGAAVAVLKFLSYVEPDDDSAFGFRPNAKFITLLLTAAAGGLGREKGPPTPNDQTVIKKLIDVSGKPEFWGFDGVHGQGKLSSLLVRLGLARWNQEEDKVIPTEMFYIDYPYMYELPDDGF
ncbi:MAG: hypothetical protein C5B58_01100 [Acidobacteria bacterium]|nr:MAG: hypothetical protein C5B58_01100 [Acidobacteriota bacterium]